MNNIIAIICHETAKLTVLTLPDFIQDSEDIEGALLELGFNNINNITWNQITSINIKL